MNVQKLFRAVKNDPDQSTLTVAVTELEHQGYSVTVDDKYNGSAEIIRAEEEGELEIPAKEG